MFYYVTDTNKQTWCINVNKILKMVEVGNSTLIYFVNGDTMKTDASLIELAPRMNDHS